MGRAVGERRQVAEHRRPQQLHDLGRERRPELDAARAVLRVVALALHELAELVGGVARDGDADAEGGDACRALAVHTCFLTLVSLQRSYKLSIQLSSPRVMVSDKLAATVKSDSARTQRPKLACA